LIGREEITKMKKGAILLNLARGEVVDTEALAEALKRGDLSGAARWLVPKIDTHPAIIEIKIAQKPKI
jgi:D-3-phosphoglycerate dehydrogenase